MSGDEKIVIVTGAAGGIGRAVCEALESKGYLVIGVDASDVMPSISAKRWIRYDLCRLSDSQGIEAFDQELTSRIGDRQVSGLVNNAAVQRLGPLQSLPVELLHESLAVNCIAAFSLTKLVLRRLPRDADYKPSVINITSIHSRLTKPGFSVYATSKAALEGLTRSLAVECGDVLKVCCIAPAAVETSMLREGFENAPERMERLANLHPTRFIGMPSEVAGLVLALLGNEFPFANGAVWNLDGGMSSRLHDPV